jgi:hypothetical protein
MEGPRIEPTLDNQIKFVEFMLEVNKVEILMAIKESLIELQKIKEDKKDM